MIGKVRARHAGRENAHPLRRKAANGMGQQAASVHKLEVTNGKRRDCVHSCVLEPFLTRLVGEDS